MKVCVCVCVCVCVYTEHQNTHRNIIFLEDLFEKWGHFSWSSHSPYFKGLCEGSDLGWNMV